MKYTANPFAVEASKIKYVRGLIGNNIALTLDDGRDVEALPDMTARVNPKVGDYWVKHWDGFVSIAPKVVFEKYYNSGEKKK